MWEGEGGCGRGRGEGDVLIKLFTLSLESLRVAKHCLQHRKAVQLSLKPPSKRLPRLSAEITARVPK